MAGQRPKQRIKAAFADKRKQSYKFHDGTVREDVRREIATTWKNEGGMTLRFAAELEPVIVKALGGKPGDRVFFDVYEVDEDGQGKGRATKRDEDDDSDF